MKVKEAMMRTVTTCHADTDLGAAVEMMWKHNCGILPVVDASGNLIGVVTDRDICIALGTRNRLPGDVTVNDVATKRVFWCKADDDIRLALNTMAEAKVRRLPVLNKAGGIEGILSTDDIVLHAATAHGGEIAPAAVVNTLKSIYAPVLPELWHKRTAAA